MGMILRIASSRIVGQGDIVGRSGYFSLNLSANSVMRGRLDARRTLKSLVADLRIQKNVRYPEEAHKNGIQGRVIVSVVIDENGRVVDPVIMRSRYPALDEEALRIVGLMPQWKPGMQQGKAVKVEFTFPVTFKLE